MTSHERRPIYVAVNHEGVRAHIFVTSAVTNDPNATLCHAHIHQLDGQLLAGHEEPVTGVLPRTVTDSSAAATAIGEAPPESDERKENGRFQRLKSRAREKQMVPLEACDSYLIGYGVFASFTKRDLCPETVESLRERFNDPLMSDTKRDLCPETVERNAEDGRAVPADRVTH